MSLAGLLFILLLVSSCKKMDKPTEQSATAKSVSLVLQKKTNPYSSRNVQKAKVSLAQKNVDQTVARGELSNAEYVYFQFDPSNLPQTLFQQMENDSTVRLLDFPFANGEIYNDNLALDEAKADQLKDGSIYGVTAITNPIIQSLASLPILNTQLLDTLTLIPEDDSTLIMQSFVEAGYNPEALFGICLFKRPHGYVRYWDKELNNGQGKLEPVRNIQVWGLIFGIPIHTYTDDNGYYNFPWRFSLGTIMGTNAKNGRVNVKPLNTNGGFFQVVPQLIVNFIVGSVYIKGWVSSCAMRNDVNFDFYDHKQNKYWAQLLNAYAFHDDYCVQDEIHNAPDRMVCYAQWDEDKGVAGMGSSAAMLLGHISFPPAGIEMILNNLFGANVSLAQNFPTFFNLLTGLLPDNTFKVCSAYEPPYYSSRLAQTAFHELGHASQFFQVGEDWYAALEWAELFNVGSHNYGNAGTYNDWGKVQVAESWAEFIGTQDGLYRYGMYGYKISRENYNNFINFQYAIEYEHWFANDWIPSGVYHDLIDDKSPNPLEPWDLVFGSSISDQYYTFSPETSDMCTYKAQFLNNYPWYNRQYQDVTNVFWNNHAYCK